MKTEFIESRAGGTGKPDCWFKKPTKVVTVRNRMLRTIYSFPVQTAPISVDFLTAINENEVGKSLNTGWADSHFKAPGGVYQTILKELFLC